MLTRVPRGCRTGLLLAGGLGLIGVAALADPTITSFAPAFGSSTDPNYITISGSGFTPGALVVKFNGVQASEAGVTDLGIDARVPAGAPLGSGLIYVSVDGVGTYSLEDFTVIGPGPYISGFWDYRGGAGASVTIAGAHFSYPLTVRFNGQPVNVPSGSSDQGFSVTVPPGVTSGLISVSNSAGMWTATSNFYGPPVITGFSPTNGRAGTNVLISGTNLLGALDVRFGSVYATSFTVLSNNAIQVLVPANAVNSILRVSAPQGPAFSASKFIILPTITGFSPTFGAPGTNVTITGANLNEGSGAGTPVVKFNGVTSASVSGVSFGQVSATVPAGTTTGPITVTTTNGTATSATLFYLPPRIASFSPTNSAPGTTVTITGTNFTGTSSVLFNGISAQNILNVTSNSLLAIVPNGVITGPISLTTPGGTTTTATLGSRSNFYGPPSITGFSPSHGLPGTNVTVTGQNFLGTTLVTFNGLAGTSLNILSNSAVSIKVPTNATTGPISLTAPAGLAVSSGNFVLDYSSDLHVTVTNTPNPVTVSNTLTYSVQVKNRGPYPAPGVLLSNTLPASVVLNGTPVVSTGTVTNFGHLFIASFGMLNSNAVATLTASVTPQTPALMLTNLARATSGYTDPILTNNAVTNFTFVEPFPLLAVAFNPPLQVKVSWAAALSNYTLQFKPDLATNFAWTNVPGPPVSVGGSNVITETNSGPAKFYRLKR